MMNAVFVKSRAKRHARQAMIDASVRRLNLTQKFHTRIIALFGYESHCRACEDVIAQVRANYRQLYAEVYK